MSRMFRMCCVLLLATGFATPLLAGGNVNLYLGARALSEDAWEPLENLEVLGIAFDFGGEHWPIRISMAASISHDDRDETFSGFGQIEEDLNFTEFSLGIQKQWHPGPRVHPYLGGGISSIHAEFDGSDPFFGMFSEEDNCNALYVHGGAFGRLGSHFSLGFDMRIVRGQDLTLFGNDVSVAYHQIALFFGWGWQKAGQ